MSLQIGMPAGISLGAEVQGGQACDWIPVVPVAKETRMKLKARTVECRRPLTMKALADITLADEGHTYSRFQVSSFADAHKTVHFHRV